MRHFLPQLLPALAVAMLLSACGTKGPLYLPPAGAQAVPANDSKAPAAAPAVPAPQNVQK